MFDQSFTSKNLARIYHSENKRGVNVAGMFFPEILKDYEKIKRVRRLVTKLFGSRRRYSKSTFEARVYKLYEMKRGFVLKKNEKIEFYLESVARQVSSRRFSFKINKLEYSKNGKDVYVTSGDAVSFFAEKQIQKNIKYTYGVKQADRDIIVPQLRSVLGDTFPKFVIKADIDSFYESIDQGLLIKKLNENPILSLSTRKLIAQLLRDYNSLTGKGKGVPRGIGISAYLSELYLKDFDKKVRDIDNLVYYSRYVDDIVVVISPSPGETVEGCFKKLSDLIKSDFLSLNESKSEQFDYSGKGVTFSFDYLGYKFRKNGKNLYLSISDKKKEKYIERIKSSVERYKKNSVKQPRKAKKEFFMRLRFLTANTSLSNNKGNAVVGIYNTNKWATDTGFLESLDSFLDAQIKTISDNSVKKKARHFKFSDGFLSRKFCHFSPAEFKTIVKVWSS
ncbi:RNA-directed DNA polymerase [Halomonas urmiana]|uniref:RNA-directed DNA polymerase n=1 Tax=Halomonas urmiana TaxID=490901 RepID=A0A5R8MLK0_9GAMM|nr:antiviral reverse transcriptase Drt3a [Halomonas urmiana]TLF53048.1 RNA-directed DNA polymerase [Halomonas urmiana]